MKLLEISKTRQRQVRCWWEDWFVIKAGTWFSLKDKPDYGIFIRLVETDNIDIVSLETGDTYLITDFLKPDEKLLSDSILIER